MLLSPASASFDMYANFMEKGNHFKDIVNGLTGKNNQNLFSFFVHCADIYRYYYCDKILNKYKPYVFWIFRCLLLCRILSG